MNAAPPPGPLLNDVTYQVVVARRAVFDQMLWQAPVLSFTAQAFLFTIALGPESSRFARAVSSLLALVISVLSTQLLARYRAHEMTDADLARDYEDKMHWHPVHGQRPLLLPPRPGFARWLAGLPSFQIWSWGLGMLAVASAVILLLALVRPSVFG